jgi:hypothetical protein
LIFIFLFIAYCLLLLLLTTFKSAELFLPAIYQLEAWLGGDKLMHLKLSILLSLFACMAAQGFKYLAALKLVWRLFFIQIFLMLALLLDESHQYLAYSRRFEWLDYYYGISGLFIGLGIYCTLPLFKYCLSMALGASRR